VHDQPVSLKPYTFDQFIQQFFVIETSNLLEIQGFLPLKLRYISPNPFPQSISFFLLALIERKKLRQLDEESFQITFGLLDDIFK